MSYAKELQPKYSQFDELSRYFTERAVCYALEENGLQFQEDFEIHKTIENVPFNKTKRHEVDFVLSSCNGEELYVEIKGLMTYGEVNKLRYLLESENNFYILQLTEIDWMEPYKGETSKDFFEKSKKDFEEQIKELVDFVKGKKTGAYLNEISKERLNDWINYRNKDLEKWRDSK